MKRLLAIIMMVMLALAGLTLMGCSDSGGDSGSSSSDNSSSSSSDSGGDSGGDTGTGGSTGTASVALYMTDDISDYQEVKAVINSVSVSRSSDGTACSVLSDPMLIDLAELSSVVELVAVADCPVASYNRLNIVLQQTVTLMDAGGISNTCAFTSYKDDNGQPNALSCAGEFCTLNVNGAVNVLAGQSNAVGLDFNLRDFEVEGFGTPACSVTMKVSPLNASELEDLKDEGNMEAVEGTVSNLDTTLSTFTLTHDAQSFSVLYNGVAQTGIGEVLTLAQAGGLTTIVQAADIDLDALTITANAIYIEVDATVSGLNTIAQTFTLIYGASSTLGVNYTGGEVEGTLTDGAVVEVKLDGFDGVNYSAGKVEVESEDEEEIEDDL